MDNSKYEELLDALNNSKFINNTNRRTYLAEDKKGYSNPVGLKWNYLNGSYESCKFDEVNGDTVFNLVCDILKKEKPDFKFNALTINKNFLSNWHYDRGNNGDSCIFALGDFSGGRLMTRDEEYITFIDIYKSPYIFKASEIEHRTESFSGLRYCVVAYWI